MSGQFKPGQSGNPGGRPKTPGAVKLLSGRAGRRAALLLVEALTAGGGVVLVDGRAVVMAEVIELRAELAQLRGAVRDARRLALLEPAAAGVLPSWFDDLAREVGELVGPGASLDGTENAAGAGAMGAG